MNSILEIKQAFPCLVELTDVSLLSPHKMADYHLMVASIGRGILPCGMERRSENKIVDFHGDLVVALGDAMTKEFLPWSSGQTILSDPIQIGDELSRFVNDPRVQESYVKNLDEDSWDEFIGFNPEDNARWLGVEQCRIIYGMRQELSRTRGHVEQYQIVKDISRIVGLIIEEIDRVRRGKVEDSDEDFDGVNDNWGNVQEQTRKFIGLLEGGARDTDPAVLVQANILFSLVHKGGGSIFERLTVDSDKCKAYKEILDATAESDEMVASYASEFGKNVYLFLSGKRQSLITAIGGCATNDC